MEYTLTLKFVKCGLKLFELVTGVLRDASFALVRLDRTHIHNFFNRTGGSDLTRNAGIEDQLEFLEERD